jgi:membrane protein
VLQGVDRAVVLAAQAFTALIPLLLLVSALAPADNRDIVSVGIIRRFQLGGGAADAVRQLFAHSGDSATGVFSAFLLFFSGVSLARRMQRMYQQAWGLEPSTGVGRALNAAFGLAVLVLGIGLLYLARTLLGWVPAGDVLVVSVSVLGSFVLWTTVPWLLLDRRVAWRRLIPTGALAAVASSIYGVASTIYMPRQLESYSERYGLFGVTLALVGWLVGIALILVATTAIASEFDRTEARWARRLRRTMRIGPPAVDTPPLDELVLDEAVALPLPGVATGTGGEAGTQARDRPA